MISGRQGRKEGRNNTYSKHFTTTHNQGQHRITVSTVKGRHVKP